MKLQSEAHIPQKEAGGENPKTSIARRLLSRCGWADPAIRKRVINDRHQAGGGIAQRGVSSLTSTHLELRSNHYQFSWQYYHPSVKGQYSLDRSHHSFVWEAPLSRSLWEGFSSHFTEEVLQISLFQNQFFFASGKGNRPDVLEILANLLLGKMKCFSVPILNCVVGSCRCMVPHHCPQSWVTEGCCQRWWFLHGNRFCGNRCGFYLILPGTSRLLLFRSTPSRWVPEELTVERAICRWRRS